ncbi:Hsp70 family protein [Rhodococcoides fascians]|uniref:Hsp70 family protein n=1 Tax=Rhodococcoides fascians TaxID=1828 RepID=UPI00056B5E9A|nr:Hsp70 family protein [Rhodococcus fascians]
MTVLLGVSMGAHAVRMALPRNGTALLPPRVLEAPQQLFFRNQVIDTVDDDVEYLAAESISAVAAESEPSMSTGVAYRDEHQADTLVRALDNQHLHNYRLVHEVEAVVEYLVASGEAAGYSTVALYDLGSSGLNVSVVDLDARRVITTRRTTEFSGDRFDEILRDNQLQRLHKPLDAPDIDLFTRRCRVAKERLSGNDAVCLPDESGMILLSRDSYETLITDEVDRSIEFARDVLIAAHVPIDAVVLVGGGSRIPLVRKRVGPSLDLPALTPNEPESVAARGAALSARPAEGGAVAQGTAPARSSAPNGRPVPARPAAFAAPVAPRPTDATPTISISRDDLPADLPPLVSASALSAAAAPSRATPPLSTPPPFTPPPVPPTEPAPPTGPAPEEPSRPGSESPGSEKPVSHFALKNVYWLDAAYEDDDGEDESERTRRRVRSWSVVGVAAAAVIAVSGFLLTRPSSEPAVVDTAVTQAPAPSVAATTPPSTVPSTPVAPVAPPPPVTTTTEAPAPTEATVAPQPQSVETQVTETQQAPPPAPTQEVPEPAPAPPPLIPGLPDFTLPTIPPLFPPAP